VSSALDSVRPFFEGWSNGVRAKFSRGGRNSPEKKIGVRGIKNHRFLKNGTIGPRRKSRLES
jgi:hypothetical protein